MKKLFAMLLVLAMVFSMVPVFASAEETTAATPKITDVNMTLEGILDVNFWVDSDGADMSKCSVQVSGAVNQTVSTPTQAGGLYVYTVKVPAHKLPEALTVKLVYDGTEVQSRSWSVFDDYLSELTGNEYLTALAAALQNYGTYAAAYANAEAGTPIDGITAAELEEAYKPVITVNGNLAAVAALYIDDAVDLHVKFNEAAWQEGYQLKIDGENADVVSDGNGKLVYTKGSLLPQDWSHMYNIQVVSGDAVVYQVSYGVNSYVYQALRRTTEVAPGLNNLLKSMYRYGNAAVEYIPHKEYAITYVLDGGTLFDNSPAAYTAATAADVVLPVSAKLDHMFLGWYDAQGNQVTSLAGKAEDITLTARWSEKAWDSYELEKAQSRANSYAQNGTDGVTTLFVGDSFFDTTQGFWGTYAVDLYGKDAIVAGIGGSTTEDWYNYLTRDIFLNGIAPKNIVMNIGNNDIYNDGMTGVQYLTNTSAFFQALHQEMPNTNIYVFSITPRTGGSTSSESEARLEDANALLQGWCADKDWITFIDISGEYIELKDDIHPKDSYYASVFMEALYNAGCVIETAEWAADGNVPLASISMRDPYILNADGTYYLYGTQEFGRITVYESKDLSMWKNAGVCFEGGDDFWGNQQMNPGASDQEGGYWAPEVHAYNGAYYMLLTFTQNNTLNQQATAIFKASSPVGPFEPWSDGPITPAGHSCLDATLYVENGTPYLIFAHEWQCTCKSDGTGSMAYVKLSDDLKTIDGNYTDWFSAAEFTDISWWDQAFGGKNSTTTDGPFVYTDAQGQNYLLWATHVDDDTYVEIATRFSTLGTAINVKNNSIDLYNQNGGHGMIFTDNNGQDILVLHAPNTGATPRVQLFNVTADNGELTLAQIQQTAIPLGDSGLAYALVVNDQWVTSDADNWDRGNLPNGTVSTSHALGGDWKKLFFIDAAADFAVEATFEYDMTKPHDQTDLFAGFAFHNGTQEGYVLLNNQGFVCTEWNESYHSITTEWYMNVNDQRFTTAKVAIVKQGDLVTFFVDDIEVGTGSWATVSNNMDAASEIAVGLIMHADYASTLNVSGYKMYAGSEAAAQYIEDHANILEGSPFAESLSVNGGTVSSNLTTWDLSHLNEGYVVGSQENGTDWQSLYFNQAAADFAVEATFEYDMTKPHDQTDLFAGFAFHNGSQQGYALLNNQGFVCTEWNESYHSITAEWYMNVNDQRFTTAKVAIVKQGDLVTFFVDDVEVGTGSWATLSNNMDPTSEIAVGLIMHADHAATLNISDYTLYAGSEAAAQYIEDHTNVLEGSPFAESVTVAGGTVASKLSKWDLSHLDEGYVVGSYDLGTAEQGLYFKTPATDFAVEATFNYDQTLPNDQQAVYAGFAFHNGSQEGYAWLMNQGYICTGWNGTYGSITNAGWYMNKGEPENTEAKAAIVKQGDTVTFLINDEIIATGNWATVSGGIDSTAELAIGLMINTAAASTVKVNGYALYVGAEAAQQYITDRTPDNTLSQDSEGYYLIKSGDDLHFMENSTEKFRLTQNITCTDTISGFAGILDGNGKTITTTTMIFGTLSGAKVGNLTIQVDTDLTGNSILVNENRYAFGALAGVANSSTIENVTVSGNGRIYVDVYRYVGGLVGCGSGSSFKNCTNNIAVTNTSRGEYACAGGILGGTAEVAPAHGCTFTNCVNNGTVISEYDPYAAYNAPTFAAGGIIGFSQSPQTSLTECSNYGTVKSQSAGGIVGVAIASNNGGTSGLTITDCVNETTANIDGQYIGGILGYAKDPSWGSVNYCVRATISGCTNKGTVKNTAGSGDVSDAGGIVGRMIWNQGSTITDCHNEGTVEAHKEAAAIVGAMSGGDQVIITSCTNSGTVMCAGQTYTDLVNYSDWAKP